MNSGLYQKNYFQQTEYEPWKVVNSSFLFIDMINLLINVIPNWTRNVILIWVLNTYNFDSFD